MGNYFWVWYLWGWSTIHSIVIHNRGSLSQVPWRKDAEGQIGFLTEWGTSYLGTVSQMSAMCPTIVKKDGPAVQGRNVPAAGAEVDARAWILGSILASDNWTLHRAGVDVLVSGAGCWGWKSGPFGRWPKGDLQSGSYVFFFLWLSWEQRNKGGDICQWEFDTVVLEKQYKKIFLRSSWEAET